MPPTFYFHDSLITCRQEVALIRSRANVTVVLALYGMMHVSTAVYLPTHDSQQVMRGTLTGTSKECPLGLYADASRAERGGEHDGLTPCISLGEVRALVNQGRYTQSSRTHNALIHNERLLSHIPCAGSPLLIGAVRYNQHRASIYFNADPYRANANHSTRRHVRRT